MNQKQKIVELAKANHGILLTSSVDKADLGRWVLKDLETQGTLLRVQRGVFVLENSYVDDFFLLQLRYPQGIFSHETALYLHGFSDRAPINFILTFKQGTSTSRMKKEHIKAVTVVNNFRRGTMTLTRPGGTNIKVYNIERTLIDLLKPRYSTDLEQFIPALKKYMSSPQKDINKMFRYAKTFGVEQKLRNYIQVLL